VPAASEAVAAGGESDALHALVFGVVDVTAIDPSGPRNFRTLRFPSQVGEIGLI
jgi:hypothetical protein